MKIKPTQERLNKENRGRKIDERGTEKEMLKTRSFTMKNDWWYWGSGRKENIDKWKCTLRISNVNPKYWTVMGRIYDNAMDFVCKYLRKIFHPTLLNKIIII